MCVCAESSQAERVSHGDAHTAKPSQRATVKNTPPSGRTLEVVSHLGVSGGRSSTPAARPPCQWVSLSDRCLRPQDLADDLSTELSGNFRSVVLGLLMLQPVYDAYELRTAIKVRVPPRRFL